MISIIKNVELMLLSHDILILSSSEASFKACIVSKPGLSAQNHKENTMKLNTYNLTCFMLLLRK